MQISSGPAVHSNIFRGQSRLPLVDQETCRDYKLSHNKYLEFCILNYNIVHLVGGHFSKGKKYIYPRA
jgi:hypothetical protein